MDGAEAESSAGLGNAATSSSSPPTTCCPICSLTRKGSEASSSPRGMVPDDCNAATFRAITFRRKYGDSAPTATVSRATVVGDPTEALCPIVASAGRRERTQPPTLTWCLPRTLLLSGEALAEWLTLRRIWLLYKLIFVCFGLVISWRITQQVEQQVEQVATWTSWWSRVWGFALGGRQVVSESHSFLQRLGLTFETSQLPGFLLAAQESFGGVATSIAALTDI